MSASFEEFIENYLSQIDVERIAPAREMFSEVSDNAFSKFQQAQAEHQVMKVMKVMKAIWGENDNFHRSCSPDDDVSLFRMADLADKLSIMALYQRLEVKYQALLQFFNLNLEADLLSYWPYLQSILPEDVLERPEFDAVNELRLLNDAIKHQNCVSKPLATQYSYYGEFGAEFTVLSGSFERLKPLVSQSLKALYVILKSKPGE